MKIRAAKASQNKEKNLPNQKILQIHCRFTQIPFKVSVIDRKLTNSVGVRAFGFNDPAPDPSSHVWLTKLQVIELFSDFELVTESNQPIRKFLEYND